MRKRSMAALSVALGLGSGISAPALAAPVELTQDAGVRSVGTYTYFARGSVGQITPEIGPWTHMFYPGDATLAGATSLDFSWDETPHTRVPGSGAPIALTAGELTDGQVNAANLVYYWNGNTSSPAASGRFDILLDLGATYQIASIQMVYTDTGGARFVTAAPAGTGAQLAFTANSLPTSDSDLSAFGSGQTAVNGASMATLTWAGDTSARYAIIRPMVNNSNGSSGGGQIHEIRVFGEIPEPASVATLAILSSLFVVKRRR